MFFTADTHFNDPRVLRIDRRPFADLADHDAALIDRWNAVVGPDDIVWHLGDFARGDAAAKAALLSRLNGRKQLVTGNNDDADTIAQKIRKAKTDPDALPSEAEGLKDRPEARNLVNIYAALSDQTIDQVLAEVGGQQFGTFKPALAELAVSKMGPITAEMQRLMADEPEIDRILARGAEQAREITTPILKRTYEIVGMVG